METITFDDIKLLFRETDKKLQESDRRMQESDRQLKRKLDHIGKIVGGMGRNNGAMAEEYFYRRLKNHKELLGIQFTHIQRDLQCENGKLDGQYDIALFNGKYIIIVEVKYKMHENDIIKFRAKSLPKFKLLFPAYADKVIYAAMAGMVVPPDCKERCEEFGFLCLTQAGKDFQILNQTDFQPKEF